MLALAMTVGVYGLAELVHGYGFVAVFVAAVTIRNTERRSVVVQRGQREPVMRALGHRRASARA